MRHGGRPLRRSFEHWLLTLNAIITKFSASPAMRRTARSRAPIASLRCSITRTATPDDDESEERFKECSEAYSVLSDQQKRATYDRFGHDAFTNGGGGQGQGGFQQVDLSDLFGEMFGFGDLFGNAGGRGGRRSRAQRGADIREDLTITL